MASCCSKGPESCCIPVRLHLDNGLLLLLKEADTCDRWRTVRVHQVDSLVVELSCEEKFSRLGLYALEFVESVMISFKYINFSS